MKKRIIYFDYLRVIAILAVIILHVAAQNFNSLNGRSLTWNIHNFYDGLVRWGVPIFVMISGSLFLSREIEIKTLYKKNISRLVVVYLIWAVFYAVAVSLAKFIFAKEAMSFAVILENIIVSHYHLWFIPMIIGLYMCVPIIREIVKSKSLTTYFLSISFVFSFLIPQFVNISNDFIGGTFAKYVNKFDTVINEYMGLHFVLGFPFYFILGYYMNNVELTKKQRSTVYILGILGFAATIALNAIASWKANEPRQTYYNNFSINVLLEAIAIHTWFKYRAYDHIRLNTLVSTLAKYSFGAYLVHVFVILVLNELGLNTLMCSPIVSIPVVSLISIVISFAASWILNKLPIINKWVV